MGYQQLGGALKGTQLRMNYTLKCQEFSSIFNIKS